MHPSAAYPKRASAMGANRKIFIACRALMTFIALSNNAPVHSLLDAEHMQNVGVWDR